MNIWKSFQADSKMSFLDTFCQQYITDLEEMVFSWYSCFHHQ